MSQSTLTRQRGRLEAVFATLLRGLGRAESTARTFDGTIAGSKKKAGMQMDATTVIGELESALAALPDAIAAAYMVAAGSNSASSQIDAKIAAVRAKAAKLQAERVAAGEKIVNGQK